jgi:AcrR family transcriptional regulator
MTITEPDTGDATVRRGSDERRQALLDATARIVITDGIAAVTMERIAVEGGVSKALPYRHFSNALDAIQVLRIRQLARMMDALDEAIGNLDGDAAVAASVAGYLDHVAEHGALLARLAGPGVQVAAPEPPHALAGLLAEAYESEAATMMSAAAIVAGVAVAASESIAGRVGTRAHLERIAVAAALAACREALLAGRSATTRRPRRAASHQRSTIAGSVTDAASRRRYRPRQ